MIDTTELRRLVFAGDAAAMLAAIDRLERAEKTNSDWLRSNAPGGWIDDLRMERNTLHTRIKEVEKERDEFKRECFGHISDNSLLRAKVAAMERQEPVAWLHETRRDSDVVTDAVKHVWGKAVVGALAAYSIPLYALPGAQNVPTALLVAVANLVAQMEIVSRVGFVDTPNDKDSCAAFCVAEGTWLELMSAVESLASALAAAQEAKPCP